MWVWQRATSDTDDAAESILYRPDCLQKVCYNALDLARLSKEVAAFAEEKSEVAILHSRTSKAFDADKFNSVTVAAYEALTYTGNRVSYLSDNQLIRGEWKDKKLLVIPNAIHIKEDLLCALRKFIEGGGKVVIYGRESLSKNDIGKNISNEDRDYIFNNAQVFDVSFNGKGELLNQAYDMRVELWPILSGLGLIDVWLRDKETGEPVYYNEWRAVEYEGKTLVNICNYDWFNEPEIEIIQNGKVLTVVKDLKRDEEMNVTLLKPKSYEPKLYIVQ